MNGLSHQVWKNLIISHQSIHVRYLQKIPFYYLKSYFIIYTIPFYKTLNIPNSIFFFLPFYLNMIFLILFIFFILFLSLPLPLSLILPQPTNHHHNTQTHQAKHTHRANPHRNPSLPIKPPSKTYTHTKTHAQETHKTPQPQPQQPINHHHQSPTPTTTMNLTHNENPRQQQEPTVKTYSPLIQPTISNPPRQTSTIDLGPHLVATRFNSHPSTSRLVKTWTASLMREIAEAYLGATVKN